MGLREELNKRPKLAVGIAVGALVVGIITIALQLRGRGTGGGTRAYFTVDDGATFFEDSADKLPPFDYKGKQAVGAHVFECPDGKKFVNHLHRYTPERRKLAEDAAQAAKTGQPPPTPPSVGRQSVNWGIEVKKPGEQWVAGSNLAKFSQIVNAKCPNGHEAMPIEP